MGGAELRAASAGGVLPGGGAGGVGVGVAAFGAVDAAAAAKAPTDAHTHSHTLAPETSNPLHSSQDGSGELESSCAASAAVGAGGSEGVLGGNVEERGRGSQAELMAPREREGEGVGGALLLLFYLALLLL
jgi:hypothetical protein